MIFSSSGGFLISTFTYFLAWNISMWGHVYMNPSFLVKWQLLMTHIYFVHWNRKRNKNLFFTLYFLEFLYPTYSPYYAMYTNPICYTSLVIFLVFRNIQVFTTPAFLYGLPLTANILFTNQLRWTKIKKMRIIHISYVDRLPQSVGFRCFCVNCKTYSKYLIKGLFSLDIPYSFVLSPIKPSPMGKIAACQLKYVKTLIPITLSARFIFLT